MCSADHSCDLLYLLSSVGLGKRERNILSEVKYRETEANYKHSELRYSSTSIYSLGWEVFFVCTCSVIFQNSPSWDASQTKISAHPTKQLFSLEPAELCEQSILIAFLKTC